MHVYIEISREDTILTNAFQINVKKKTSMQFCGTLGTFIRYSQYFFFKLVFTPCKDEQPLRGMKLQKKEAQKG